MTDTYPRLLADIGGTNARFGWLPAAGAAVQGVRQLAVAQHAAPADAARAYLQGLAAAGQPAPQPRWAALAVATPVGADEVAFTNSHWRFSRRGLQAELGLDGLLVLNDFEALALSLPVLDTAQLLSPPYWPAPRPDARAGGTLAVIGPGTGLGVGGVVHTAAGWVALPGEGGHVTLAAADDFEAALLAQVRRQYPHVSAERLLSGIGLPLLHQAVGTVLGQAVNPAWDAAAIVQHGGALQAPPDALAARTLDAFCALLGGVAGNVALTLGARGGVYLGGGILPRIRERFFASGFRQRFTAKGRFEAYLQAIPTPLLTDTLAALAGCALAIEQAAAR